MEQVIKQYMGGFFAMLVTMFIIANLFVSDANHTGILKEAAKKAETTHTIYTSFNDVKNIKLESEKKVPVLKMNLVDNTLVAGCTYTLSDIVSMEGEEACSIILKEIRNGESEVVTQECYLKEAGMICIQQRGIYTMRFLVNQKAGKKRYFSVDMIVKYKEAGETN